MNSFLGIAILFAIAILFSNNRKSIRWRTVGGAFAIQVLLAAFVLYVPFGQDVLYAVASGVSKIISFTSAGIDFMFGGLASADFGFVFAIISLYDFFRNFVSCVYWINFL